MQNPFSGFGWFLGALGSHLITLLAGCVLTVMLGVLQKYVFKRPLSVKEDVAILLIFLFFACFQAARDEHRNTQIVIAEKSTAVGEQNSCLTDYRVEQAFSKGLQNMNNAQRTTIDNQTGLFAKQQGAINSCVVSLGKLNPVITERTTALAMPTPVRVQNTGELLKNLFVIVILTNHKLEPRGRIKCNQPFSIYGFPSLHAETMTVAIMQSPPEQISDEEYGIWVRNSGAIWDDNNPIYFAARSSAENLLCTFTPGTSGVLK